MSTAVWHHPVTQYLLTARASFQFNRARGRVSSLARWAPLYSARHVRTADSSAVFETFSRFQLLVAIRLSGSSRERRL
jgi:hypothetical protein